MLYKVMIDDETDGELTSALSEDDLLGTIQTVRAQNENGLPEEVTGKVTEVLESSEF